MASSKQGKLPIVCIHTGDAKHLAFIIGQAKQSNPDSEFIFIGDRGSRYYSGIKHVEISDYYEDSERFAKIYRHTNPTQNSDREIFFHQRWLILSEYMRKTGLEACFNIDSDILIYEDLGEIRSMYGAGEFSVVSYPGAVAHGGSSFISAEYAQKFSDLIFKVYEDEASFNAVKERYGCIGEMQLLHYFKETYPEAVFNTFMPVEGRAMQDSMTIVSEDQPYEGVTHPGEIDGHVTLHWKGNKPYGRLKDGDRSEIEFTLLHLHGPRKKDAIHLKRVSGLAWVITWWNFLKYKISVSPRRLINRVFNKKIYPKF